MKLRLACADFTFPILPHDQVLQLIAMLGIKGVDIGLFEDRSHLRPSTEFKSVRRAARRLKKRLDDHGLVAADIFLQLALDYASRAVNHPRPQRRREARNAFLRALDYTAGCSGKHLTGLPGVHHEQESRRDSWAKMAEELSWRVERAGEYGITFAVEAHVGSIVDTPKRAQRLIQDVPGLTLTPRPRTPVSARLFGDRDRGPDPVHQSFPCPRRQPTRQGGASAGQHAGLEACLQEDGAERLPGLDRVGIRRQRPDGDRRSARLLHSTAEMTAARRACVV